MKTTMLKPAIVLGLAGALTLGAMTSSQARVRPWVAAGIGLAAGAALASAAAANAYYYGPGYSYHPVYPVYGYGPYYPASTVYVDPGYSAYASAPAYAAPAIAAPRYRRAYHGYDTNYIGPLRERQLEGRDY
jgi:hypothetical protein